MLLSKIGNLEYNKTANINFKEIAEQALEKYNEAFQLREIKVMANINDCRLWMDAGLAEIMANNLLKNALKHNVDKGHLDIKLTAREFIVANSGTSFQGNPEQLFQRFNKGEGGNYGIGLSIVKQICDLHNFALSYKIEENSTHILKVSFLEK